MTAAMSGNGNRIDDHFGMALAYLMLGVTGGLALDLCAKKLLEDYAIEQFVFLRSAFGIMFFFLAVRWYGGFGSLKTKRWGWHLLRTVLATGAMFGFFYGLARMPLVNALTIAFMAPLIVTALSVPFLGEHVGWRRWLAVIAGFIGVVIVLRPGEGMFTPAATAVIIAAFCWAGLALTARKLAATETTFSLSVYITAGPLIVSTLILPGNYSTPTFEAWVLFILAGLSSALAWVGIVGGYRRAPPDRRGDCRLPDLGRGSGSLGHHRRTDHHWQRYFHRIPRSWRHYGQPLPAGIHVDRRRRNVAPRARNQEVISSNRASSACISASTSA
jgi:drug/metabolite transporter (DMT)-like permease